MTLRLAKLVDYLGIPYVTGKAKGITKTPAVMNTKQVVLSLTGYLPPGLSPGVHSITVLSSISIRIRFDYPAMDNASLHYAGNYLIAPSLTVYSVTPETATNPTYVDLVIDEQVTGVAYTVTLQRIVKA